MKYYSVRTYCYIVVIAVTMMPHTSFSAANSSLYTITPEMDALAGTGNTTGFNWGGSSQLRMPPQEENAPAQLDNQEQPNSVHKTEATVNSHARVEQVARGAEFQVTENLGALEADRRVREYLAARNAGDLIAQDAAIARIEQQRRQARQTRELAIAGEDLRHKRTLRNIEIAPLSPGELELRKSDKRELAAIEAAYQTAFKTAMKPTFDEETGRRIREQIWIQCAFAGIQLTASLVRVVGTEMYNAWDAWRKQQPIKLGSDGKPVNPVILTPEIQKQIATNAKEAILRNLETQQRYADLDKTTAEMHQTYGKVILDMQKMIPSDDPNIAAKLKPVLNATTQMHFARVYSQLAPLPAMANQATKVADNATHTPTSKLAAPAA